LLMGTAERWLDFFDVAHAHHAAHLLTLSDATSFGDSASLAPIKEKTVDDVTIKNAIADVKATYDDLLSTSYGKQFIKYRRIVFAGIYGV